MTFIYIDSSPTNRSLDNIQDEDSKQKGVKSLDRGGFVAAQAYIDRHTHGEMEADPSDDDISEDFRDQILDKTPMTRKRLKSQHELEKIGKIGPVKTFFTLFKGFVATGILFLPKGFKNGGWLFSTICLSLSSIFTIIASRKLLAVYQKYRVSYPEIGFKAYGRPGKILVDFFLAFTQIIFVCAYITFIVSSINNILKAFDKKPINNWILGACCFVIYVPLTLVRKIEKFAFFHIFADVAIMIGVTVILVFTFIELDKNGTEETELINKKTFLSFVGLAAYTFEGIGIIIPVMETTSRPDLYPMILTIVIAFITVFYLFVGNLCYFVWDGKHLEAPLITDKLDGRNPAVIIVDVIWIINLIFTYPLVLHPGNIVIESYVYAKMGPSIKRTWLKNISRTILVAFTVILSVALMETLDKLESINGAFACIPLAFTLPNLFHYKLIAKTRAEKIIDMTVVVFSVILQIVCTVVTFLYWND